MRKFVVECDGCGKKIELTQENYDRNQPVSYHMLQVSFRTFMIDPNTNQEEEVSNMARQTSSVYCYDCFMKLTDHLDKFIEEVEPDEEKFLRSEYSAEVRRNQALKEEKMEEIEEVEFDDLDALRSVIEGGEDVSDN